MTQRTLPWADAQPLYVALKQLEQAVQGEDVPEFERLAVMGDIARRAANVLAAFEIKYPEIVKKVHMDEKASQEAVLLDLGNGNTLRCGYDETAEMAFLYGSDGGGSIVHGCYWDHMELRGAGDAAPERVLGGLAKAGVLFNAEAVVSAILAFLSNPPKGEEDQADKMAGKKVYALVDVFITNQGYYVLASSREKAQQVGGDGGYNYISSSVPEYDHTEVQGEAKTLTLKRTGQVEGEVVVIVPTNTQDASAYRGYRVDEDSIGTLESTYPRSEWQIVES